MKYKALVIGGSAGSFQGIVQILASLPPRLDIPVFLSLHRLKHVREGFDEALGIKSTLPVTEPMDKDNIRGGKVYLAPANYHMYIELGNTIALSTEEPVNHSRPSIDLTLTSAAYVYKDKMLAILLSGANRDGAEGMKAVASLGGKTMVQDPKDCQVKTMTEAALKETKIDYIYKLSEIVNYLKYLR